MITHALLLGLPLLSFIRLFAFAVRSATPPADLNDVCLTVDFSLSFALISLALLDGPGGGTWLVEDLLVVWLADNGWEGGLGAWAVISDGFEVSPLVGTSLFWLDDFSGELDLSKEKENKHYYERKGNLMIKSGKMKNPSLYVDII